MSLVAAWSRAFVLTLLVEEIVVLAMTRRQGSAVRRVTLTFVANLATHPIVWFVIPVLIVADTPRLIVCEAWAIGLEAVLYAVTLNVGPARALGISAIANAASFGVGVIVRAATGWV